MRVLINIRGVNGSGKSTIVKSLIENDKNSEIKKIEGLGHITIIPSLDLIAIGKYEVDCGGCDGLVKKEILKLIQYVAKNYNSNIIFEGMVVSSTHSTYSKLFKLLELKYGFICRIIHLDLDYNLCINRVYDRNGGKPINEKVIYNKSRVFRNAVDKFRKEGFKVVTIKKPKTVPELRNIVLKLLKW